MSSTSVTSSIADLPAVLHNAARRYGNIATGWTIARVGGDWVSTVSWPDDVVDPGDPGPDPAVVALGNALATITDTLTNEQTRLSNLFAERIDLQAQRTQLAIDKAAVEAAKTNAEQLLNTAQAEKARIEQQLVAKQKELDDYKAAHPAVAAVRP